MTNYLIIGQGIAGSMLAYHLMKVNASFKVIDFPIEQTASKVSSGLINPVTGRILAKTWLAGYLLPYANTIYPELEKLLGKKFFQQQSIIRFLKNQKEKNEFDIRSLSDSYDGFMEEADQDETISLFNDTEGCKPIRINQVALLNTAVLLDAFQLYLKDKGLYQAKKVEYQDLELVEDGVFYEGIKYTKVIFCEGYKLLENPWFNYLPFRPNKGERLLIKCDNLPLEKIVKHQLFVIPLGDQVFWVGSNYNTKGPFNEIATEEEYHKLKSRLDQILSQSYQILNHQAAVRPSVKDRRPLIGTHPKHSQLMLFNGMGTKGISLAPYFANHLVEHLTQGTELRTEINIKRYESEFYKQ